MSRLKRNVQYKGETKIRINIYLSQEAWDIAGEQGEINGLSRSAFIQKVIIEYNQNLYPSRVTLKEVEHLFW